MAKPSPFRRATRWSPTEDADYPWRAQVDDVVWRIRVNDFPEDPTVYSLLVGDAEPIDFDTWPRCWRREKPADCT